MLNKNTVNKVILLGQIGHEPRWHKDGDQLFLCFPLITTEKIKANGEQQIHEEIHKIRVPAHLANDALITGITVYIQGRIQTKMFLDDNRIRHYRSEIVAITIEPIEVPVIQYH